jgi:hypothetical protein
MTAERMLFSLTSPLERKMFRDFLFSAVLEWKTEWMRRSYSAVLERMMVCAAPTLVIAEWMMRRNRYSVFQN